MLKGKTGVYNATVSAAGVGINASKQSKDRLDKNIKEGGWDCGKKAKKHKHSLSSIIDIHTEDNLC